MEQPFNLNELDEVLNNLKMNKAMGEDQVANELITNITDNKKEQLLTIINNYWQTGEFPPEAKQALVIPLLKDQKDPALAKSYRPITLLSCLGKVYETLVYKRLTWHIEKENLLPDHLMGFRPERSTTEAMLILEDRINQALNNKKYLIATFVDIAGAFDAVDHSILIRKCMEIGLKGKILKFIKNYLSERSYRVIVGKDISEKAIMTNGVPQGSPLSPTLFNIMMADYGGAGNSEVITWADDIINLTSGDDFEELVETTQEELDHLKQWSDNSDFIIATEAGKTCYSIYTRRKIPFQPNFKIGNNEIPHTKYKKYLGLTWDSPRLTWTEHIKTLIEECKKRIDIMKRISNSKFGASRKTLQKFYETYIYSKLNYGLPIYAATNKTNLKKLEALQNTAIRISTGAFKSTPIISLNAEAGAVPIRTRIKIESTKLYHKTSNKNIKNPITKTCLANSIQAHNNKKKNFFGRARETLAQTEIPQPTIISTPAVSPIPPWHRLDEYITDDFGGSNQKDMNETVAKSRLKRLLEEKYKGYNQIYTDGSRNNEDLKTAASIYVQDTGTAHVWRLPNRSSIGTAEIFAIKMAIKKAVEVKKPSVIFTDSQVGTKILRSMKPKSNKNLAYEVQEILRKHNNNNNTNKIYIQWIPAHKNLQGNEMADKIAKQGLQLSNITFVPPDPVTISKTIKRTFRTTWKEDSKREIQAKFYGRINPRMENQPMMRDKCRKVDTGITRLRLGHSRLKHHLYRLGIEEDEDCRFCGQRTPETIEHVMLECPRFYSYQTTMKQKLRKENIPINIETILGGKDLDQRKARITAACAKQYLIRTAIIDVL